MTNLRPPRSAQMSCAVHSPWCPLAVEPTIPPYLAGRVEGRLNARGQSEFRRCDTLRACMRLLTECIRICMCTCLSSSFRESYPCNMLRAALTRNIGVCEIKADQANLSISLQPPPPYFNVGGHACASVKACDIKAAFCARMGRNRATLK